MKILLLLSLFCLSLTTETQAAPIFKKGYYVVRGSVTGFRNISFNYSNGKINQLYIQQDQACTDAAGAVQPNIVPSFGGNDFRPITVVNSRARGALRISRDGGRYTVRYDISPSRASFSASFLSPTLICDSGTTTLPLAFAAVVPPKSYVTSQSDPAGLLSFTTSQGKVKAISVALLANYCNYGSAPYNILVGYTVFPGSGLNLPINSNQFEFSGVNTNEFNSTSYDITATYDSRTDNWLATASVTRTDSAGTCSFNGQVTVDRE